MLIEGKEFEALFETSPETETLAAIAQLAKSSYHAPDTPEDRDAIRHVGMKLGMKPHPNGLFALHQMMIRAKYDGRGPVRLKYGMREASS